MARRSTFVAIAAVIAAAFPLGANAAVPGTTPTLGSAAFTSPVTINWTGVDPTTITQEVWRSAGACGAIPGAGAASFSVPPISTTFTSAALADGTYCFYVEADDALPSTAYSGGLQVTVDATAPTAGVPTVTPANPVRATVTIAATNTDAGTGVVSSVSHYGVGACTAASALTVGAAGTWDTTTVVDGTYVVCNVVTDGAGRTTTSAASAPVLVDNTAPAGAVLTPAGPGAFVHGNPFVLTASASDANGTPTVQWQRSANGNNGWSNNGLGGVLNNAPYARNWNTTAANTGDGADWVRAVITDAAGNQTLVPVNVTVDNTVPDVAPVLTAPPAVAGSPTLSWTAAHDALGIARYDVLRGGVVVGSRVNTGAATYSFADTAAPDQVSSSYTVRAYDNADNSVDSAATAVLVDSNAVSAPRGITAPTPTASAPTLSWQAPATFGVDHYDVYREGQLLASTTGPTLSYTDATATEGEHDYAVMARGPAAQSGVLSRSFKVVLDKTPPTSGGALTAQVLASGSVQLAWPAAGDALSGVAGYVVRRAPGGAPPTTDAGTSVCTPTVTSCADSTASTGIFSYGVFARDGAGNVALIGTVANVTILDKTAPLAPTKLTLVKPKSKKPTTTLTYTLRWLKPIEPDLERVVVVLNLKHAPTGVDDGTTIYKGTASSTKVKLRAGQTGYLALYSVDLSGNVSPKPARTTIKLAALIPLRPLNGSTVRIAAPLLSWKAKAGTSYYNVQVFVKGKRVLTGWPSSASFRIPKGKLTPGTYVWYVWPAVKGKGSSPTFGKLIGRATFKYKK